MAELRDVLLSTTGEGVGIFGTFPSTKAISKEKTPDCSLNLDRVASRSRRAEA